MNLGIYFSWIILVAEVHILIFEETMEKIQCFASLRRSVGLLLVWLVCERDLWLVLGEPDLPAGVNKGAKRPCKRMLKCLAKKYKWKNAQCFSNGWLTLKPDIRTSRFCVSWRLFLKMSCIYGHLIPAKLLSSLNCQCLGLYSSCRLAVYAKEQIKEQ